MAYLMNDGGSVVVSTHRIGWDARLLAASINGDSAHATIDCDAMEVLCGSAWESNMPIGVCVEGHLMHNGGTQWIEFPGSRMAPLSVDVGRGEECPD